ncbi:unnamed protein product [Penicillium nalgiovense]|nr:unnamed protein product [Penicillium nalgiovense]
MLEAWVAMPVFSSGARRTGSDGSPCPFPPLGSVWFPLKAWAARHVLFFGARSTGNVGHGNPGPLLPPKPSQWAGGMATRAHFFFSACNEQLSPLVFFSGLVGWHGLPCPFSLHVRPIRFPPESFPIPGRQRRAVNVFKRLS